MEKETTTNEIMEFLRGHMVTKEDFNGLDSKVNSLDEKVNGLSKTVNNLPDKDFLTDKMADLEGAAVARQRKQDNKTNRILEALEKFEVLPKEEVDRIRAIHVFPPPPIVTE